MERSERQNSEQKKVEQTDLFRKYILYLIANNLDHKVRPQQKMTNVLQGPNMTLVPFLGQFQPPLLLLDPNEEQQPKLRTESEIRFNISEILFWKILTKFLLQMKIWAGPPANPVRGMLMRRSKIKSSY